MQPGAGPSLVLGPGRPPRPGQRTPSLIRVEPRRLGEPRHPMPTLTEPTDNFGAAAAPSRTGTAGISERNIPTASARVGHVTSGTPMVRNPVLLIEESGVFDDRAEFR